MCIWGFLFSGVFGLSGVLVDSMKGIHLGVPSSQGLIGVDKICSVIRGSYIRVLLWGYTVFLFCGGLKAFLQGVY